MRKTIIFSVLILLCCGAPIAKECNKKLPPHSLFSSRFIIDYKDEIELSKGQMQAVSDLVKQLQSEITTIHKEIFRESQRFQEFLTSSKVDEKEALARIDKILNIQNREHRSRLFHLIRLKNILTDNQQERLLEIRRKMVLRGTHSTRKRVTSKEVEK